MRILGCLIIAAALSGNAMALEASAGTDTVNASTVGIDAKLNATNAITTATINQILNCQKAGKLYDPTTNTCIAVDEPLAKKIAACTTNKQFYNQNNGACQASAPDLTSQLNTTNSNLNNTSNLLNAVLNCNANKQFYNRTTGTCVAPAPTAATGTVTVDRAACGQIGVNKPRVQKDCPANTVMVSAISYGIATGSKQWYGNFVCCPLKIQ